MLLKSICLIRQVVWEHLYNVKSGRDVGTLMYFRNLFGRNNVKAKVKDSFAPAEDLFLQVFTAYVLAAFMDFTGMTSLKSPPTEVPVPAENIKQEEKSQYLEKVIGSFVDSFCFTLPNVEDAFKRQNEQQSQQNASGSDEPTVSCNLILPGTLPILWPCMKVLLGLQILQNR